MMTINKLIVKIKNDDVW